MTAEDKRLDSMADCKFQGTEINLKMGYNEEGGEGALSDRNDQEIVTCCFSWSNKVGCQLWCTSNDVGGDESEISTTMFMSRHTSFSNPAMPVKPDRSTMTFMIV
ncbi:uncharacterized protein LOC113275882 [Papaver somniferum]|uniref:uncharacterized protein LOC113275882 n=1 Tax=Papaver somniferum TaxID=3469 RepID=UPI000E6F4B72|nr:uncharacterized protein LOC113275882 [Papaver somniferum]